MAEKKDPFQQFFSELVGDDDEKTLRIFERKASDNVYYTLHGDDALWCADEFFKTREILKGENEFQTCTIRPQRLCTILRHVLLEKKTDYVKVEFWQKPESDVRGGTFKLTKKATPGNHSMFEEFLEGGDMSQSTSVMALKIASGENNQQVIGVAFVDVSLRTMEVAEFLDTERFVNFESVIVQKGASECIFAFDRVATTPDEQKRIRDILTQNGVKMTERKSGDFKAADVQQDLNRLVGSIEHHLPKLEKKAAMGALASLIKYLELLRDASGHGHFKLKSFDLAQFMKLDKSAVDALNLFPTAQDSDKNMSLYGLLNKCRTSAGSRLLSQWIKQPLLEEPTLTRRQNYVELFMEAATVRTALMEDHLRRVPDLDRMAKKFQKGKASLQTVVDFYKFSVCLPGLVNTLKGYTGRHVEMLQTDVISKLETSVTDLSPFESMVEQTIDLDAVNEHEYLINPAFDKRLEDLKVQRDRLNKAIQEHLEESARSLDLDLAKVKLSSAPLLGEHFRISRKDEKVLRGNSKFMTLDTRKDGVRFTTIKMKKYSKESAELKQQYEEVQKEIVGKCLEVVVTYTLVMEQLNEVLSELDVLVAFAHVATNSTNEYVRPKLLARGSGRIELLNSRHPCLEVLDHCTFIANDAVLIRDVSNVQVITGPNMGGKSTYIRQIGVIVLMAQIGSFVPCSSAEITLVDCILARVGAGDSQLKGVSTFMKEMLEASHILKSATGDSLIIIDELGRGTSTYDGFGLAWAIAEHIAKELHSFALFATHFHELTALAQSTPCVVNRHVTAQATANSITMLYKVNDGPCDRSFGIHVAELANFPPEVVQAAKRKAVDLENFGSAAGLELLAGGDGVKRARVSQDMEASDDAVGQFLKRFAAIPMDALSDADLQAQLGELRQMVEQSPELRSLLPE